MDHQTIDAPSNYFPTIIQPNDNLFSQERFNLGKELFFEPLLSRDSSLSCGSCHLPQKAFSDTALLSKGFGGQSGTRNTPSILNVAYAPYFTFEGGVHSLEMQVLVPVQEAHEFNMNILEIIQRLEQIPSYQEQALKAYNRPIDAFVITRALAVYERTLVSNNSRYDQYTQGFLSRLTALEKKGLDLFFSSKTNCSQCHEAPLFTNYNFENNGLYEVYDDPGRFRLTNDERDWGRFKVPSLRNVELTAPYMHDGSFNTLEEVVAHYNSGGFQYKEKSDLVQPLFLDNLEQEALVAFLKSLTDTNSWKNEFIP